jgi:hypothetical protein
LWGQSNRDGGERKEEKGRRRKEGGERKEEKGRRRKEGGERKEEKGRGRKEGGGRLVAVGRMGESERRGVQRTPYELPFRILSARYSKHQVSL